MRRFLLFLPLFLFATMFLAAGIAEAASEFSTINSTNSGVEVSPQKFQLPGSVEGAGTYFEIKDSKYLNISLESTEEIKVVLESIPRMISLDVEAAADGINSTELTLKGLEPIKTYYKYQDSYKNGSVFVSNENGIFSWNQNLTQSHHIWFQEEKGTTFIDKDTFLDNDIEGSVEITADNITLDCNGHSIRGSGWSGYGIYLNNRENITIKRCKVNNFSENIYFLGSDNSYIINNTIEGPWQGITLDSSSNNTIINNNILNHLSFGIEITGNNNKTYHNNFIKNGTLNAPPCSKCGVQAYFGASNFFDNGYPLGGNYWEDDKSWPGAFQPEDKFSGPNQDQPGSDGIGDIPYKSFGSGQDNYPFTRENGWEAPVLEWVKVSNTPYGIWKLRETAGTTNLEGSPKEDVLKLVPNDWVLKLISKTDENGQIVDKDGYLWWKVENSGNGVVGWMAAQKSDGSEEYLTPGDIGKTEDLTTKEVRVSKILEAVDHYYNNICLTTIRCQSIFTDNVFKDS